MFRFTGKQLNQDALACAAKVIREAGLTADEEPVANIRTSLAGVDNPNWGGGPPTVTCDYCGKPVTARKRDGGKLPRFCDSECYGKWMHEHPETVNGKRVQIDWTGLASLYDAGMSTYQLAEHYGCSRTAVKAAMRKNGITSRPTGGYRPKGGFYQSDDPLAQESQTMS